MNKNSKYLQMGIAVLMLMLAILACGSAPAVVTPLPEAQQATAAPGQNASNSSAVTSRAQLIKAAVQIFGVQINNGKMVPIYVGSGSIISPDGLILTNAHVAYPPAVGETGVTPDALVVGIVQSEDKPPVLAYRAEVKAIDGFVDLAVLQITSTIKGDSIDPSSLNLPYVGLGDSDTLHVGDHLAILGFPLIGGNTVTFTSGDVAGFSAQDQLGDRAWIKTDAPISGGNSGGMGTNDQGQLIGVPSISGSGAANTPSVDCRPVQDTNGDGVIDNKDTCVPLGEFINGLRPVNLAMPLIKAAEGGQKYNSPYANQQQQPSQPSQPSSGNEQIGPITWYSVDSQGNPDQPVTSYPAGTTTLVGLFKFTGFTDGEPWSVAWSSGGKKMNPDNFTWDQGSQGTYAVSLANNGDPIPDGSYHVDVFVGDGQSPLAQSDVTVGSSSSPSQKSKTGGVQISGTVTDKNSGNPVSGALLVVLKSGMDLAHWKATGLDNSYILTYTQTDSNGQYSLPVKLARNMPYTFIISAQGYPASSGDGLEWKDSDPANFTLDFGISQ